MTATKRKTDPRKLSLRFDDQLAYARENGGHCATGNLGPGVWVQARTFRDDFYNVELVGLTEAEMVAVLELVRGMKR